MALPVGGLYYFFLLQVFQISSQLLGLDYYPSLIDTTFSVTLAATVIGYFYLLSSYIAYVARRRRDLASMFMMSSIIMIFASPFIILSYPSAASENAGVKRYHIVDGESCASVPVSGEAMEWDQARRTCYMRGNFIVGHHGLIEIADNVTLEILTGGNLTTIMAMNNNGTIVVNGGILQNSEGYIYNNGNIDHKNGLLINNGVIENGRYFDGNEVISINPPEPSRIVNRVTFENNYYVYNYGNFTNLGLLDNSGQIDFFEGTTINAGTVSNNGRIEITGGFDNKGKILNSGVIVVYRYSDLGSPIVLDNSGEIINTVGEISNLGTINNRGSILNELGEFENHWDQDKALINNEGVIANVAGEFLNDGIVANSCSGVVEGEIQNTLPTDLCRR
ncbi:MAG TPA: hypothetical protein VD736_03595 [Nitrososphaera sp.]|nr:hypothetical protein [Nitrososphaera sp.]